MCLFIGAISLNACISGQGPEPLASSAVATLSPSPVPITPTLIPQVNLAVTVWTQNPRVPILGFHRFVPDRKLALPATQVTLEGFQAELQLLYDNGYSLVSLPAWLRGDLSLPVGRKPLIISIDDAVFADQISIDATGQPRPNTGIGILWQFSQDHPDFGFSAVLFANFGDKYYGNVPKDDWFIYDENWQASLGEVLAWCLDHNVQVYNHLYMHPRLDLTLSTDVHFQIEKNDQVLRNLLILVGRQDLIKKLDNIIALPYGVWPTEKDSVNALLNYVNPEGKPVEAIFEADSYMNPGFLLAPYDPLFDRFRIPRINGSSSGVNFIAGLGDPVPAADFCYLGPLDSNKTSDMDYMIQKIDQATADANCPFGIYAFSGFLIQAQKNGVREITLPVFP
jgi:hypothetical protein